MCSTTSRACYNGRSRGRCCRGYSCWRPSRPYLRCGDCIGKGDGSAYRGVLMYKSASRNLHRRSGELPETSKLRNLPTRSLPEPRGSLAVGVSENTKMTPTFLHEDKNIPPDGAVERDAPPCASCGQQMWVVRVDTKLSDGGTRTNVSTYAAIAARGRLCKRHQISPLSA